MAKSSQPNLDFIRIGLDFLARVRQNRSNEREDEMESLDLDIRVIGIDNDGSAIYWDSESGDTWVDGLHFLEIESI